MVQRELSFVPAAISRPVKASIIIVSWNVREDMVKCLWPIEDNHRQTTDACTGKRDGNMRYRKITGRTEPASAR